MSFSFQYSIGIFKLEYKQLPAQGIHCYCIFVKNITWCEWNEVAGDAQPATQDMLIKNGPAPRRFDG